MEKQLKNISKERKIGLDIVRTVAVILVLTVHFFLNTKFYSTNIIGKNMYMQLIIRNFCMICVPLFIIITGYFNKEEQYNKKFFKKLLQILIIWVFYSFVEYIYKTPRNLLSLHECIRQITNFEACSYSWYINMYIGLYLVTPLLNNGYKNLLDNSKKYLLLILIIITFVSNTFNQIFNTNLVPPQWWVYEYPLTYYFIGKYIYDVNKKIKKINILKILLLVNLYEFLYVIAISNSEIYPANNIVIYNSIINAVNSVCVFLLLYDIDIKSKFISNIFKFISIYSLDIYLASSLIDKIVYNKLFDFSQMKQQQIIFKAPIVLAVVFSLSLLMGIIRKKIINVR